MSGNDPIIDPSARIAADVEIGPWTIIGPNVEIGAGSRIDSHVVIRSNTRLGSNTRIFQFASVGEDPSDLKFQGEETRLEVGDNNVFREGANIHRGTGAGGGVTRIGNDNLFLPYTHVAHDCVVGNHTIFSNNAAISGHVTVEDWVILGGYSGVYQFLRIGAHSFIGALTHVNMDVPTYVMVNGSPPSPHGINIIGLQRRGFSKDTIRRIREAYKVLYRRNLVKEEALEVMTELARDCPEIQPMIDSVRQSTKGILR